MIDIKLKYQAGLLCGALHRNINDNFITVSFSMVDNQINIKIVLEELTEKEEDYIDDLMAEFSVHQDRDCVFNPIIEVGDGQPLENVVYKRAGIGKLMYIEKSY